MGLDDGAADRQPHAHPPGTRAEVRVKNPVPNRSGSMPSPLSVTRELNTAGTGELLFL